MGASRKKARTLRSYTAADEWKRKLGPGPDKPYVAGKLQTCDANADLQNVVKCHNFVPMSGSFQKHWQNLISLTACPLTAQIVIFLQRWIAIVTCPPPSLWAKVAC